ncbi:MAG: ferredoxin family protein [Actinomycetota bacterium]
MGMPKIWTDFVGLPLLRHKYTNLKLTRVPVVKDIISWVLSDRDQYFYEVPIYEDIETPDNVPLPPAVVERLIDEASYQATLNFCFCRYALGCEDYPIDFGCTFLGEGARQISRKMATPVTKEEAKEHYRRSRELGLITMVGKFKGDAIGLGVRNHRQLMTVCHCCPCCCIRDAVPNGSQYYQDLFLRLDGLTVEVDPERCIGCGTCVEVCTFKQRSMVDGVAVVGEGCKGCGLCAMRCKGEATRMRIDNPDYIDEAIRRLDTHVDVR